MTIQLNTERGSVRKIGPIQTIIMNMKSALTSDAKCVLPPADSWSELGAVGKDFSFFSFQNHKMNHHENYLNYRGVNFEEIKNAGNFSKTYEVSKINTRHLNFIFHKK